MSVYFALADETFKYAAGNAFFFNKNTVEAMPKNAELLAAKGDTAAFQLVLLSDERVAVSVGKSQWFSQKTGTPVLRISVDAPFEAEVNLIGAVLDDDGYRRPDILLTQDVIEVEGGIPQTVYFEMMIPFDAKAGKYDGSVSVCQSLNFADEVKIATLPFSVEVADFEMPEKSERRFHLDLWQHNSNIARKHDVSLWSDEHFAVMESYVKTLGELGQSAATVIVADGTWSGQGCMGDYRREANMFEYSIISTTRSKDGKYSYDYTAMRRYIDLCAKYGIDAEIEVFGLVNIWGAPQYGFTDERIEYPDGMHIRYFDEADGNYKYMTKVDDIDAFIRSLADYFIHEGLIDKVRVAADEPGDMERFRTSITHLLKVAPEFRLKAAINHAEFIAEFGKEIDDFVPFIHGLSVEYDKLMEYTETYADKRFLWYVCCGPDHPNTFICSDLLESRFIGILTSYTGLDGFLRWAYSIFPDHPRDDLRYGTWHCGDVNFVYPAYNGKALLSLRYKQLKRGIDDYELIELAKAEGFGEIVKKAFDCVVREKDPRKLMKADGNPIEKENILSLDPADYKKMRRLIYSALEKK